VAQKELIGHPTVGVHQLCADDSTSSSMSRSVA
jgi:hypothetical protein